MQTIERKLQQCLNKLKNWSTENGFKFSKTKTNCMNFHQKRGLHPEPQLTLDGTPIPVVKENTFLGLIFYNKLTFILHIKHLKVRCKQDVNKMQT